MRENLLAPEPTLLNEDPAAALLAAGVAAASVVKQHPESSLGWATLAREARLAGADELTTYAFARVGYHRGLDALRKGGWRGQGPVPYSHEPNRGVLHALYELQLAASAIAEPGEAERLEKFLNDSDATALAQITAKEGS